MRRALFVASVLLCFSAAAPAVRVPGLYEADVAVPDQSNSARVQGVVNALRAVIVKLSGDRAAAEKNEVGPILRVAERYLLQYRYLDSDAAAPQPGATAPPRQLRLLAQFDQGALDRDLRGAGVAIWGPERPATLTWLAISDGGAWHWPGGEGPDDSLQALADARARGRGLVLVFPLHDLDDAGRLDPAAVAAGESESIRAASERYRPDGILTLAVDAPAPGQWRGRWTLLIGGDTEQWNNESPALEEVIRDGIDRYADHLARAYAGAGAGAEEGGVTLNVVGVSSAAGYARALRYLESLNSVTGVQVTGVAGDQVTFVLSAYGGSDAVRQAITLGRVLERAQGPGDTYRLAP
jgi:hypothetical protein